MIKLRSLLTEDYIGKVDAYDAVHGVFVNDSAKINHHEYGMMNGKRWRYCDYIKEVIWTDEPSSLDDIYSVNNWLNDRKVYPEKHYYQNDELWNKDEENLKEMTNSTPPAIIRHSTEFKTNNPAANQQKIINDQYILIATIWGEARGEGEIGMKAVLNVIMNRSKGDFNKASSVALKPKQFSFWNNKPNSLQYATNLSRTLKNPKDIEMYNKAIDLVEKAKDHKLDDITGGALFYFNPSIVLPSWSNKMIKTCTIGHHDFYKLKPKK